jgi:FkbM family methyltransferase
MAVLDVGAHIGYFSLVAARLVGPTGQVWSFEPDPANRANLERNVDANGAKEIVTVVPLAVTSTVGKQMLHRVSRDTGSSTMYPTDDADGEQTAVTTTSLDEWAHSEAWPPLDLIKIDAEGAESAILAGMSRLLARNPSIVVVLEFQADALETAGEDPIAFLERLLSIKSHDLALLDDRGTYPIDNRTDLSKLARRSRWSPLNLVMRSKSSASKSTHESGSRPLVGVPVVSIPRSDDLVADA